MNREQSRPVLGACIVIFAGSMFLLTLCAPLFDMDFWLSFRLLLSLILTALGGLILSLRVRLGKLEAQVRFLQEQLYKLEKDMHSTSKYKD